MGGFRSDLEAAHAHAAKLEAAIDRVELERARLEAALRARRPRRWPWVALAVGSLAGGVAIALASGRPSLETAAPRVSAAASGPMSGPTAPPEPGEAITPVDSAFFGQYWRARVTRAGAAGPPVGTECLITLEPGLYGGAGQATVRCGAEFLHRTAVTPPYRANEGFCWFDSRELYCAPPDAYAQRDCWVSTAAGVATCHRDIDLYIHTRMRDPRERPPPSIE